MPCRDDKSGSPRQFRCRLKQATTPGKAVAAIFAVFSEREAFSMEYRTVRQLYFQKRALKRYAGVWSLWALGAAR